MPTQLTFFFLFVAVLALIGVVAWLVRRFAANRLGSNANRGRMQRLAVIDATAVDGRRRLVLVRRDNIEHLIMIGGPTDIVIEPNIVRAAPQRDQVPLRGPVGAELPPRAMPLPDASNWTEAASDVGDDYEPMLPELPPRPARPSLADEMRRASSAERRNPDQLTGLASEPMVRSEPRPNTRIDSSTKPRFMPRSEPMVPREPTMPRMSSPSIKSPPAPVTKRSTIPTPSVTDQNLAEMAQRLEAALRKPASEPRTEALVTDRVLPIASDPSRRPAPSSSEAMINSVPRSETSAPPVAPIEPKISPENLEDTMVDLLGRPKNPS